MYIQHIIYVHIYPKLFQMGPLLLQIRPLISSCSFRSSPENLLVAPSGSGMMSYSSNLQPHVSSIQEARYVPFLPRTYTTAIYKIYYNCKLNPTRDYSQITLRPPKCPQKPNSPRKKPPSNKSSAPRSTPATSRRRSIARARMHLYAESFLCTILFPYTML